MVKVKKILLASIFLICCILLLAGFSYAAETFQAKLISKGNIDRMQVALTFDVEGGTDIEQVLAILREYQVKATFFLLGTWVEQYPQLARSIAAEGHEIGNHTYSHPQLTGLTKDKIIKEIQKAEELIIEAAGVNPRPYFRPPYGATNSTVLKAIGEAGYDYSYFWSIDPRDWDGKSARKITDLVLNNLHPGAIVLLHVNKNNTVEALPLILEGLLDQGYRAVALGELTGNNQLMVASTAVTKTVWATSQASEVFNQQGPALTNVNLARIQPKPPQGEQKITEVNFSVNGKPVELSVKPRIISNRTFIPARDIGDIIGGMVGWEDASRQVNIILGEMWVQFSVGGETRVNGETLPGVPSAILVNNRVMVPLYLVSDLFNLPVLWQGDTKTVEISLPIMDS